MDSKLTVTVSNQIKSNQTLFIKHIYKVMYKRQLQKEKEWINIAKRTVYTVVIQSNRLSNKAWQNQTVLKAMEKRWVLRKDLKTPKEGADLIRRGRLFHNLGPATEKALSPLDLYLEGGTVRIIRSADLKVLAGVYGFIRRDRYSGASPFKGALTSVTWFVPLPYCDAFPTEAQACQNG